ncbi:aminotransferase class I/II-fold pyridoxal phosphate-dependent enzyme [Pseudoclavibacter sp. VKM Ac-2867]|uniref:aminotransferase class I/II-fold pyridoxal phosphate-dependent enzyme n=1 Tax=Pseudoclavibacter sp. VKM Ac-2867 TaxID=2783829 RepID=UPI00188B470E|nr:PLP-dependent transferase [Pseudoclavibacter sp. VKM Ac-2867]MBF4457229.1 PLP-dependent transferase [Pseudoclavibacter sp. VKM Ac-2867]
MTHAPEFPTFALDDAADAFGGAAANASVDVQGQSSLEASGASRETAGAPYAAALAMHAARDSTAFLVPGHGADASGLGLGQAEYFGERVLELDVTPLLDGIDLGDGSPREQAERLAADAWGASRTWFLTGGSSMGNRMAALAARGLGEGVLMQRSAHSSFVDGIILGGSSPSFVLPEVDLEHGIAHGVTPHSVAEALAERQASGGGAVAAVYIVSPSYFGAVADVAGIAEVAHEAGAALIVDAAWGAHFGFLPELPDSPVRLGADLVVTSTHKLTSSLSQSALVHLGHGPIARALEPHVERAHRMTASTSESSLLLASLDLDRRDLVERRDLLEESHAAVLAARAMFRADGRFPVASDGFGGFPSTVAIDPFRIPLDIRATGLDGHTVRLRLAREYGVMVEMATVSCIVAVIGIGKTPDTRVLLDALVEIAAGAAADSLAADAAGDSAPSIPPMPGPGAMRIRPRAAYLADAETVSFSDAVGRISADSLAAYPPGIPNVLPGEEITVEVVEFLRASAAAGSHVRGAVDSAVSAFRVVVE